MRWDNWLKAKGNSTRNRDEEIKGLALSEHQDSTHLRKNMSGYGIICISSYLSFLLSLLSSLLSYTFVNYHFIMLCTGPHGKYRASKLSEIL